ncbi:MAG: DUF2079 domain-containing protein [Chloroflexia bacterium]
MNRQGAKDASVRPGGYASAAALRPAPSLHAALAWLEGAAPLVLVASIALWVALVFAASIYKYETFGQGYDQVDFEQAIWNTVQGRPMVDSRFNFSDSIFGLDWMPMLLLFVPFYAAIPSPHTLFFMQILGAALGAVPLYWLARDRLGSKLAGLCAALVYLLYPTLLYGVLNPFQVRLFSVTLLLFAIYYFEKGNWKLFAAAGLLAVLARTDVALVVAMFGIYALLRRRRWPWVAAPLAFGLGYFALATFLIVPSFLHPDALKGPSGPVTDYMSCWPCGHNPVLAYYGHLGGTFPEIARYIFTHPVEVLKLMFSSPKVLYILSLLVPLAFLPLLAPGPLVLGLPILALNLLSTRSAQYDYQHHYSLLLIPGLMVATVYGADRLARIAYYVLRRREKLSDAMRNTQYAIYQAPASYAPYVLLLLAGWAALLNVPYKNPLARTLLYHEMPARVEAARELVAMVPPEAKVAASSFLAPHLLPRRYIYNFPPAPYSPYNFGPERHSDRFVDLDYILVDPKASALDANPIADKSALEHLRAMPGWVEVASKQNLLLFKRK